jgi:phage baseplate assembly protein W
MPFNAQYIAPENLNPNTGLGVSIPFSNSSVFSSTYTTQETVKNNLINYFLTNPGEIPLNPTFGAGLRAFLFEQISEITVSNVKSFVQTKLNMAFPMVQVNSLEVLTDQQDNNSIIIKLKYSVLNSNISGTLNFQF